MFRETSLLSQIMRFKAVETLRRSFNSVPNRDDLESRIPKSLMNGRKITSKVRETRSDSMSKRDSLPGQLIFEDDVRFSSMILFKDLKAREMGMKKPVNGRRGVPAGRAS